MSAPLGLKRNTRVKPLGTSALFSQGGLQNLLARSPVPGQDRNAVQEAVQVGLILDLTNEDGLVVACLHRQSFDPEVLQLPLIAVVDQHLGQADAVATADRSPGDDVDGD